MPAPGPAPTGAAAAGPAAVLPRPPRRRRRSTVPPAVVPPRSPSRGRPGRRHCGRRRRRRRRVPGQRRTGSVRVERHRQRVVGRDHSPAQRGFLDAGPRPLGRRLDPVLPERRPLVGVPLGQQRRRGGHQRGREARRRRPGQQAVPDVAERRVEALADRRHGDVVALDVRRGVHGPGLVDRRHRHHPGEGGGVPRTVLRGWRRTPVPRTGHDERALGRRSTDTAWASAGSGVSTLIETLTTLAPSRPPPGCPGRAAEWSA